jgi:hypothetical protein
MKLAELPKDLRDGILHRVEQLERQMNAAPAKQTEGAGAYSGFHRPSAIRMARDEMIALHQRYLAQMLDCPLYEHQRASILVVLAEIEILRGVE